MTIYIGVLTWSQITFDRAYPQFPTSTEESLKNGWQLHLGMTIGVLTFSYSIGMTIGVLTFCGCSYIFDPLRVHL